MNEQLKNTKFCMNCGAEIDVKAEICPKCGVRQPSMRSNVKNPGLAAVLSFFLTGLGQIYNGQIWEGILLIIIQIINIVLMSVIIGFLTYFIVWIWGMFDAYKTAEKINTGQV
jgi:TM2 domain-containing membrane protein YozV